MRRFESGHPSQSDPLAQSVEQRPFKQWVWSSNLQRVTKKEISHMGEISFLIFAEIRKIQFNSPVDC